MNEPATYRRREALSLGIGGAVAAGLGTAFWSDLFQTKRLPTLGGVYGQLGAPDQHGIRLPDGFRARLVARGREPVMGTSYVWHPLSDGAAVFKADHGGYVLVSNSEADEHGGASAIRFDADGDVRSAYSVLAGTRRNCSGGGTPWGTWLSCEEVDDGLVWECDASGRRPAVARPAMGVFKHEAAAVDPRGRHVYLTEDVDDGNLYRFTSVRWPSLAAGRLETAVVHADGRVEWTSVPDPSARRRPTRQQVPAAKPFARAEGLAFDDGKVYVATTEDSRIHAYDTRSGRLEVIYDAAWSASPVLTRVDNLAASPAGELFVCEDNSGPHLDIGVISTAHKISHFISATGPTHARSELAGVTFDPTGTRMFFASQRANDVGEVYEVTGPFFRRRNRQPAVGHPTPIV